jgi:hypothetical protein
MLIVAAPAIPIAVATTCCADGFAWRADPATIPSVDVRPSNEWPRWHRMG